MRILVLKAGQRRIEYAHVARSDTAPLLTAATTDLRESQDDGAALETVLWQVREDFRLAVGAEPEAIGVCAAFGGTAFPAPVVVDAEVLAKLEAIISQAPLHVPLLGRLLRACGDVLTESPVVLLFQTAFFATLPLREQLYALEPDLSASLDVRRCGYQGLFHEAACEQVALERLKRGLQEPARAISICLEPQPEVAAVLGRRPVMTTGGATPLEGIPGETTCGDVDPSLVLILAQNLQWGPERINLTLTQESGLLGLLGRPITLSGLFESEGAEVRRARSVIEYRILQACGAGIAALGGLDAIIFSGRYAALGEILGPWLSGRLRLDERLWVCCSRSLLQIAAEKTELALLSARAVARQA